MKLDYLHFLRVAERVLGSEDTEDIGQDTGYEEFNVFTLVLQKLVTRHVKRQT